MRTPYRTQSILVGARNYKVACEIAKRAGFARTEFTYIHNLDQFLGYRSAILLLDGTGDYSFWRKGYRNLEYLEMEGRFTVVLISCRGEE
jgi:hypothetical protein